MIERRPMLSTGAIEFLEGYLSPTMRALEFGAGGSTLWLAERVGHLISVEHDKQWYDQVAALVDALPVELLLRPRPYHEACCDLRDSSLDFVLIDGRDRMACLVMVIPKVAPGGVLMLDDSQRESYAEAPALLRSWARSDGLREQGIQTTWWQRLA